MAARRGRGRVAATVGSAPMASKLTELRPPRTPSSHNSPSRSVLGPRTLGPRDPESQGPKLQNSASQIQESPNSPNSPSHSTTPTSPPCRRERTVFTKVPNLPLTLLHLISATFFGLVWLLLLTSVILSDFFPRPAQICSVKIMNM